MTIDTTQDSFPLTTSLRFRMLLALVGKGALIQHKGKLYQAVASPLNRSRSFCEGCCFTDLPLCNEKFLYDVCVNIEDAYDNINNEMVQVVFKKYVGKLPPDEIVVVF